MRQETINVYQYDELSENAKATARQWWLSVDDGSYVSDMADDCIKPALEAIGFNNPDVYWRISYSQGDGACFTADDIDIDTFLKFCFGKLDTTDVDWLFKDCWQNFDERRLDWLHAFDVLGDYSFRVDRSYYCGNYVHEGTADFCSHGGYALPESVDEVVNEFVATAEALRRELSQAIFAALLREYEFQTSDEQIEEAIRANECEFDEFGNPF